MLHKLLEPGDWFAPKRYGYGAGLPIAWQGWALLAAYIAFTLGLVLVTIGDAPTFADWVAFAAGMVLSTGFLLIVASRRTRGGWRWRWGDDDRADRP